MTPPTAPTPMDLSEQGLREWLTRLVTVEPDGRAWRVTLARGTQRSSIIRLSEWEACETYVTWVRENVLLPELMTIRDAARAEYDDGLCSHHKLVENRRAGCQACIAEQAQAEQRERDAKTIPPWGRPDTERLLRAIAAAIRGGGSHERTNR